jgi:hypothetical protein
MNGQQTAIASVLAMQAALVSGASERADEHTAVTENHVPTRSPRLSAEGGGEVNRLQSPPDVRFVSPLPSVVTISFVVLLTRFVAIGVFVCHLGFIVDGLLRLI